MVNVLAINIQFYSLMSLFNIFATNMISPKDAKKRTTSLSIKKSVQFEKPIQISRKDWKTSFKIQIEQQEY